MKQKLAALVLCSVLAGCQASPTSGSTAPASAHRNVEDVRYLARQMQELHPDLYHWVSRDRFERAVDALVEDAPGLTDEELLVEVARLAALPALGGRDGHAGLFPMHANVPLHAFPIHVYEFSDGLFVVDGLGAARSLVGAEITAVDGVPVRTIRRRLDPLIARDNESTVPARFQTMFVTSELLQGAGITDGPSAVFDLVSDGERRSVRLDPVPMDEYADAIGHSHLWTLPADPKVPYLSRMEEPAWVEYLEESRTVYAQYNHVATPTAILEGVQRRLGEAERVVLDIRHNGGGDNTTYGALVEFFTRPVFKQPGRLYVIAGRTTFSAAGNLAGELDHETSALFVGEAPGGSPNQFGDQQPIELPHAGIQVFVPVYFVEVVPGDERRAIRPDIPVRISSEDFFGHRDPALEAILSRGPRA